MARLWTESELSSIATEAATATPAERRRLFHTLTSNPPDNLCSQAVQAGWLRACNYVGSLPMALP